MTIMQRRVDCPACEGTGFRGLTPAQECPACGGVGCVQCGYTGNIRRASGRCPECRGAGKVWAEEEPPEAGWETRMEQAWEAYTLAVRHRDQLREALEDAAREPCVARHRDELQEALRDAERAVRRCQRELEAVQTERNAAVAAKREAG